MGSYKHVTYFLYWVLKVPLWGSRSAHQAATDTLSQQGIRNTEQNFMGLIFRYRRKPEKTYQGGYRIGKPNSHTTTG